MDEITDEMKLDLDLRIARSPEREDVDFEDF